jgi:hypothetical protein
MILPIDCHFVRNAPNCGDAVKLNQPRRKVLMMRDTGEVQPSRLHGVMATSIDIPERMILSPPRFPLPSPRTCGEACP